MRLFKNQKGFTLIEMLIVMLIITVLIAIAIPNVSKQTSAVDAKGCKAFVHILRGKNRKLKSVGKQGTLEGYKKRLINRTALMYLLIAYLVQKNKEAMSVFFELPTLRKPFINRHYTDEKHFHDFLIYSSYHFIGVFIKGKEGSFDRIQTVEALFFVVREGKPLNLIKSYVRGFRSQCNKYGYIILKPFPVLVDDEQASAAIKGAVGSLASYG